MKPWLSQEQEVVVAGKDVAAHQLRPVLPNLMTSPNMEVLCAIFAQNAHGLITTPTHIRLDASFHGL
jgi:hypothetical protein